MMTDTKGNLALGPRSPRFPSSKFSAPKAAPHVVHRSRLLDELDRGQGARLTLVVGSAGAGKTALLADWVATRPRTVAWISCDVADSDPVRFVAATIEALRRAAGQPDIGEDARELLSLDGEVSADAIAALADDLQRPGGTEVLVVDDFHLTEVGGAEALALLLDYRPASLQLVVASRVDPQLRLHRMRANRELVDHLIAGSTAYASSDNLRALIDAGLQARKVSPSRPHVATLPDALTDAEVRVLMKLPQRLTYLDMASDLHLSLNTVKTHLRHTYMKLGVTSRSSAVKRATSLGLL